MLHKNIYRILLAVLFGSITFLLLNNVVFSLFIAFLMFSSSGKKNTAKFWQTKKGKITLGLMEVAIFLALLFFMINADVSIVRKIVAGLLLLAAYVLEKFQERMSMQRNAQYSENNA